MAKRISVESFMRKGGVEVARFTKSTPTLSSAERARRRKFAKAKLLPEAVKRVGQKGFGKTVEELTDHFPAARAKLIAGKLKGMAKKKGVLAKEHAYKGREGYRKYKIGGKPVTAQEYYAKHGKPTA